MNIYFWQLFKHQIHSVMIVIFVKNILLLALKHMVKSSHILQISYIPLHIFPKNIENQLTIQCPSPGTLFILKKTSLFVAKLFSSLGFFVIMTSSSSSEQITTNHRSLILNTPRELIFASKVNCVFFCRQVV